MEVRTQDVYIITYRPLTRHRRQYLINMRTPIGKVSTKIERGLILYSAKIPAALLLTDLRIYIFF